MKGLFACVLAMSGLVAITPAQPRDSSIFAHEYKNLPTIKAYHLTAAQEAEFSNFDTKRSCFWLAWEIPTAIRLDSAMVEGGAANTSKGPVETPGDEAIKLKLAWGTVGLYILFEATDDIWVDSISPIESENDAVELFLDPHSGQQLYSSGTPYFAAVDISQLTETYDHFQVRFGGNEHVEQFSLSWWNPLLVGKGCIQPAQCVLNQYDMGLSEADLNWGMKIEIIPPITYEASNRRQEWMIPWGLYGSPPGKGIPPAENDRLVMCFGYNDLDDSLDPFASSIRWRNAADPYTTAINPGTQLTTTIDSWGEILFAGDLSTAANLAEKNYAICNCCSAKQPLHNSMKHFSVQNVEYFTLHGQCMGDLNSVPSRTIVLQRSFLSNGMINVKRIVRN